MEDIGMKHFQVLINFCEKGKWPGLSEKKEVLMGLTMKEAEIWVVSRFLNVDEGNIIPFWPISNIQFEDKLKIYLQEVFEVDLTPRESLFEYLSSDSIIPDTPFVKSFIESSFFSNMNNSQVITTLFLDENFHFFHDLIESKNLFQLNEKTLTVKCFFSKGNDQNLIRRKEPSHQFQSGTIRKDNLVLIGSESTGFTDIKLPEIYCKQKISIGVIALKHDGIHVYEKRNDLSEFLENSVIKEDEGCYKTENLMVRVESGSSLVKGMIFELGNNFLAEITDLKCNFDPPILEVKIWKEGFSEFRRTRIHAMKDSFEIDFNLTDFYKYNSEDENGNILDIWTFNHPVSIKNYDSDIVLFGLNKVSLEIIFDDSGLEWKLVNLAENEGLWMLLKNSHSFLSSPYSGMNLGFGEIYLKYSDFIFSLDIE
jgi:hypothetical protein